MAHYLFTPEAFGLAPAEPRAAKLMSRLRRTPGSVRIEVNAKRNTAHHRKYWAVLNTVMNSTGGEMNGKRGGFTAENAEWLHARLKLVCGVTKSLCIGNDVFVDVPDSTAFAAMGQEDFDAFYEKAIATLERWTGIDRVWLETP